MMLCLWLKRLGYEVTEPKDGGAGVESARESMPDLIISDVNMPVMDGLAVCKTLKEDPATSDIPLVLLTSYEDVEGRVKATQAGSRRLSVQSA